MTGLTGEEAKRFLEAQTNLAREQAEVARLQAEDLRDKDAFELSHLRWRQFDDRVRGIWQTGLAILIVGFIGAILIAMWEASQARGLVIGAFMVPPALAQSGASGEVVADDLTQKIAAIRTELGSFSFGQTDPVRGGHSDEFKVQIPDTGISLDQVWRVLKSWLGQEREVTGHVRDLGGGRISFTVVLDGNDAVTFEGPLSGLGEMERKAAEHIFERYDPMNFVVLLIGEGRIGEGVVTAQRLVASGAIAADLEGNSLYWAGRLDSVGAVERYALALTPNHPPSWYNIAMADEVLGRTGDALIAARRTLGFPDGDYPPAFRRSAIDQIKRRMRQVRDTALGDFAGAAADVCSDCRAADDFLARAGVLARDHDVNAAAAAITLAEESSQASSQALSEARSYLATENRDWSGAAAQASRYARSLAGGEPRYPLLQALEAKRYALPLRALALAHSGDGVAARMVIDATASDCVPCLTTRGKIDMLAGNRAGAAYWFADAIRHAADIPFAYAAWGEMLLREGKLGAAITKFASAHEKGPRFADPLEMWGEALMEQNRSDLAIVKFQEANKYAPNWGRLHLKWGEALAYSGHRDDAQTQFWHAAMLGLNRVDRGELERVARRL